MNAEFWPTVLLLGAIVYATRVIGLLYVPSKAIPAWLDRRLRLVPAAVLAALVAPGLTGPTGLREPPVLLAAIVTAVVAWWIRQPVLALLAGLVALSLLRAAG